MKYRLLKETISEYNALKQILYNRNIPEELMESYLNTTDEDVNPPEYLGAGNIYEATKLLYMTISNRDRITVVVDSDCDGFTSAAVFINYINRLIPQEQDYPIEYILHEGKQHGLQDCINQILEDPPALVVIPDAGSNDVEECKILQENNVKVIILDHHEMDVENHHAIVLNSQLEDYPNHELSGVGVTYQFLRYFDKMLGVNLADEFLDLVAVGLIGDMMSLTSIETKHLIHKGLKDIHNPFIAGMVEKNSYSMGGKITPWNITFYVVPFVNAMVRSGTMQEKTIVFQAMLEKYAFKKILSTKRGHKDELESIAEQAVRLAVNVKNRQTKAQDAGMELIEKKIQEENLLEHKVLLITIDENTPIEPTIRGLIANKLMAKYNRPCCIITKKIEDDKISYEGSARGCDKTGVYEFKDICENTQLTNYATGRMVACRTFSVYQRGYFI